MSQKRFVYYKNCEIDDREKNVVYVNFDLDVFGYHSWKLNICNYKRNRTNYYCSGVTQKEAIRQVETWLSDPITKDYFQMVTEIYDENRNPEKEYKCKGDLLGDKIFIHQIEFDEDSSTLRINCELSDLSSDNEIISIGD